MAGLFWQQLGILVWKNWIVLSKHPFLNILRCFILPIAYGVFLAVAQIFLNKPNNYGIGSAVPIARITDVFDGSLALVWADATNGKGVPSPDNIMTRITSGFTPTQLQGVRQVATPAHIPSACPQNFNGFSECFAAIAFNHLPAAVDDVDAINYTIRADSGLWHIDVLRHNSEFERRILPLQWAIDQAIIEMKTGIQLPIPQEWPFTQKTNEEQFTDIRLSYIRGLRTLLCLALFICYIGIAYQLPGAFAGERANALTSHLKAMGLQDLPRITSWHISISLAYLPAWIIVALVWHFRIFTHTHVLLVLAIHLLLGLSLASWSFFIATPFGKSPQLAAVVSTFLGIIFAITALVYGKAGTVGAFIFSIILPPGFYIFALRAVCGFENHLMPTDTLSSDPDNQLRLLPLLIAAVIDVFLWPYLAVLLERWLHDARNPTTCSWSHWRKRRDLTGSTIASPPPDMAISIRNLEKTYTTSIFPGKKSLITAISDLTLDIPKFGIFVILGSNGAGKSTALSVIGGLLGLTSGSVIFEGGLLRPPRGTLGIVPQKNVLFPDLTCYQTLRVWSVVKRSLDSPEDEDLEQLLRDCDLAPKIHSNANTLSGGQKRKLQLAIGLVGGSKIVLVDECTSGIDPLSRRAIWRTLNSLRHERTVVLTTHFLDEADLLADNIVVLATPGKLVAEGPPVALKSTFGEGYSVQVKFSCEPLSEKEYRRPLDQLLQQIRGFAPEAYALAFSPHQISYHLRCKNSVTVEKVLQLLDDEKEAFSISSYDVLSTSIEDIFLRLMTQDNKPEDTKEHDTSISSIKPEPIVLTLTTGQARPPWSQALTIFHKRALVARRSWLTPLLTVLVAVVGSTVPTFFMAGRSQSCVTRFFDADITPLYLPFSPAIPLPAHLASSILTCPPDIASTLGRTVIPLDTRNVPDNTSFVNSVNQNFRNHSLGGISLDLHTRNSLVAWEATAPGMTGPAMLNLATNILFNVALNVSGRAGSLPALITPDYQSFPWISAGVLVALKWVTFFGAVMAVFPAFFTLYVSRERRSSVQAMQFSNGLSNPIGLWLGHLLFDSLFTITLSTLIIIIFASVSHQFHGLGLFWVILVLYGIVGTLFAYCVTLFMTSPLSSFAAVAGYQIVMFIIYLAGYLVTLTYAKTSDAADIITIIHFTVSLLSPVASVLRTAFVSVNLFSLLCDGRVPVTTSSMGDIMRYGGPILYLCLYGVVLFVALVWADSGLILPRRLSRPLRHLKQESSQAGQQPSSHDRPSKQDVIAEAQAVSTSSDLLRVLQVTKSYGGAKVVDDLSLGVPRDTIFAMLGPNGAGKTTSCSIICGDVVPGKGDVLITGISVVNHPRAARLSLGVCPQFTAIDAQLTVQEHLTIYGRLKGLSGPDLHRDVESLMQATTLAPFADRLATKLSGGNQRKLSLAIALIGNPSVILIDEFSTGIDAKMKREMWETLRTVAVGKAVVITTHSMEEASALASKVGIMAKHMLAVGTCDTLSARFANYEVHFSCRTREDVIRAQLLMSQIPGSRMADDVATRFEVPIESKSGLSLAQLFHLLSTQGDFSEYTVERATLESVFLKVIRENNVLEEDNEPSRTRWWRVW